MNVLDSRDQLSVAGFGFVLNLRRAKLLILSSRMLYCFLTILRCESDMCRHLSHSVHSPCVGRKFDVYKLSTLAQSRVVSGLRAENSSTNACLIYELVVYVEKTKQFCM